MGPLRGVDNGGGRYGGMERRDKFDKRVVSGHSRSGKQHHARIYMPGKSRDAGGRKNTGTHVSGFDRKHSGLYQFLLRLHG
jgi:hypothetical protein